MTPSRIIFLGTPAFAARCLNSLLNDPHYKVSCVVTQPDKISGRGRKITCSEVKTLALQHQIPVVQPQRIKKDTEGFLREVSAYGPFDVGVVVAFGQILPQAVLDLPTHGCVNVHASLLPRWRGAAPIQRAIIAGDAETGVQLMRMEAGLDTGPVYASARTAIGAQETAGSLHDHLAELGSNLLCTELGRIARGEVQPKPQSSDGVTYAAKISNEECELDLNSPAHALELLVRGLSPHPGAFAFFAGKRFKILLATRVAWSGKPDALAGELATSKDGALLVKCGSDALSLLTVQPEGKRSMSAQDFLRGNSIPDGARLVSRSLSS